MSETKKKASKSDVRYARMLCRWAKNALDYELKRGELIAKQSLITCIAIGLLVFIQVVAKLEYSTYMLIGILVVLGVLVVSMWRYKYKGMCNGYAYEKHTIDNYDNYAYSNFQHYYDLFSNYAEHEKAIEKVRNKRVKLLMTTHSLIIISIIVTIVELIVNYAY